MEIFLDFFMFQEVDFYSDCKLLSCVNFLHNLIMGACTGLMHTVVKSTVHYKSNSHVCGQGKLAPFTTYCCYMYFRGYGESDHPEGRGQYKLSHLVNDIKEIVSLIIWVNDLYKKKKNIQ